MTHRETLAAVTVSVTVTVLPQIFILMPHLSTLPEIRFEISRNQSFRASILRHQNPRIGNLSPSNQTRIGQTEEVSSRSLRIAHEPSTNEPKAPMQEEWLSRSEIT